MTPQEFEIVKQKLGLQHIQNPEALRVAVDQKLASMNAADRLALTMRIGRKATEAEAMAPGAEYSPSTGSLIGTALVFALLAAGAVLLILGTEMLGILKIVVAVLAIFWFIAGWRAIARVIYRSANGRDM